jgi:hypothetical protein
MTSLTPESLFSAVLFIAFIIIYITLKITIRRAIWSTINLFGCSRLLGVIVLGIVCIGIGIQIAVSVSRQFDSLPPTPIYQFAQTTLVSTPTTISTEILPTRVPTIIFQPVQFPTSTPQPKGVLRALRLDIDVAYGYEYPDEKSKIVWHISPRQGWRFYGLDTSDLWMFVTIPDGRSAFMRSSDFGQTDVIDSGKRDGGETYYAIVPATPTPSKNWIYYGPK